jgi:hypothetical protein
LVIDLITTKTIDLTVPTTLLARALRCSDVRYGS